MTITRPRRRGPNYWYIGASALIALLVIGGIAIGGLSFGNFGRTGSGNQLGQGVGEQQELMPTRNHVPEGQTVEYSTVPPTSGDHWARWGECGFYDQTLPDERITHNLEHGNIVVSYNLATSEEVDQLRQAFDDIGLARAWGIARSYDRIPVGTVVAAAWGVMDTMQGVDRSRLESFFDTYAGNVGPEKQTCTNSGVMDPPPGEQQ